MGSPKSTADQYFIQLRRTYSGQWLLVYWYGQLPGTVESSNGRLRYYWDGWRYYYVNFWWLSFEWEFKPRSLALLLQQQYELPFGINWYSANFNLYLFQFQFSIFNLNFNDQIFSKFLPWICPPTFTLTMWLWKRIEYKLKLRKDNYHMYS